MRFPRWLIRAVLITAVLLIGSTAIGYSKAEDPYRSFNGMGSSVSVAPSDDKLAFTYIKDGQEKIYTSTTGGKNPEPVTDLDQPQFSPSFHPHSPDDILFLSEQKNSVRSLYTAETPSSQVERLTGSELHVRDAAYSPDGTLIYFLGMPAEAWKSAGRNTEEGFNIYSMPADGGAYKKITSESKYLMGNISPDATGNMLLYTYTEGPEDEIHVGMKTLNNKVYEEHIEFANNLPEDCTTRQLRRQKASMPTQPMSLRVRSQATSTIYFCMILKRCRLND
ncbi:TolB family protein [Marinococcus halophilus]|uniref:TolB family protein n=1 Tax=Marinococcus halophilus TaxID=1371 RepID=UPI00361B6E96